MAQNLKNFNEVLSFSRGTGATRVNAAGLIVGVDFSTTSNTIGTGSKTFTLIADANVNRDWSVGENVLVVSQAGATGSMTGVVTSYTPSTQALVVNVTSTTGSGTSTDWRVGSLEVRRGADGLVVETGSVNYYPRSSDLTNAVWVKNGVTIGPTRISPDGSSNAYLIQENTANSQHNIQIGSGYLPSGLTSFVYTFYVFPLGRNFIYVFNNINSQAGCIDVVSGTVAAGSTRVMRSTPVGGGWYKVDVSYFTDGGVNGNTSFFIGLSNSNTFNGLNAGPTYQGDGASGAYVWGIQVANSTFPVSPSYIPTTTTSWTRNADSITFSNSSLQQFRQSQGTIYVDADFPVSTTRSAALSLTGTNSEISLARQGSGTTASFTKMVESGNTQVFGSSTAGNLFKNLGKQYEPALGTRNDTGATNTNLAIGLASNAVASSGNGFGVAGGLYELTTDSNLSSTTVRGVGNDTLNGAHWTGSRFIIANGAQRPVISLDGTSYRVINSPVITTACTEVTSGLVGAVTRVVMVGTVGSIYTSDDQGETWTARTSGTAQALNAVTFGNNRFVAIGNNNAAATSTDGITWSAATGLTGTLTDIIHTGSQFVAINTVGGVFTSTDGITFTTATVSGISPTFTSAQGIAYDNGFYTIVGNGGQIVIAQAAANATSFTFSTFVTAQTGTSQQLNEVLAFGGQFYAVGATQTVISYSQSLTPTFASRTAGVSGNLNGIAASPTTLLLVGASGAIASSTDGTTFTSRTNNGAALNGIAFGNGTFVSVGNSANSSGYIATIDADGTVTRRVSGTTDSIIDVVYYGGSTFYAITNTTSRTLVSTDNGNTWSLAFQQGNFGQNSIATNGTQIIISGTSSFTVFSPDGVSFVTRGNNFFSGTGTPNAIAFGNGIYVFVGNAGLIFTATTTSITSSTGGTLRNSGTTQNLTSVMYSTRDNCWYAAGANGTLLRSDDNAVTWYSVNGAMQGYVLNNTLQANALSRGNASGRNRFALSYANNSIKVAANGNVVTTETAASLGGITAVTLGENFNGTIRSIRMFPQARIDSELIQISLGATAPGINDSLAVNALGDTLQINAAGDTFRIN